MAFPFSTTNVRVPAGFQNLLEGLAREVLREQPTDVVAFAAQHFQRLLEQREGAIKPPPSPAGAVDPVAWGALLEDDRLTWPPSQELKEAKDMGAAPGGADSTHSTDTP